MSLPQFYREQRIKNVTYLLTYFTLFTSWCSLLFNKKVMLDVNERTKVKWEHIPILRQNFIKKRGLLKGCKTCESASFVIKKQQEEAKEGSNKGEC